MRWLILVALTTAAAPAAEKVEILRDEYGVPHIFAATAQGAAFASGHLQASDRAEQLLRHLSSAKPTAVSPELRPIIDAFCAGLHAAGAQEVEPEMVAGYAATLALGGSTIVIPADRTASQAPIAIIDPLENYDDTPYQMVIGGGYNWVGAVPVGLPFPLTGHGYDSVVGPADLVPGNHILDQAWRMQAGPHSPAPSLSLPSQTTQMTRALLGFNAGTTIYDALRIATSSEVYRAGVWQKRIASVDADSAFARVLTGWSRRAEFNSAPALAFYLFKMALGTDAMAIEPPDSLSDNRVRAALRTAQDQLETKYPFQAAFGTLFQVAGKPASGGTLTEAGMATPRAVTYEKRGSVMTGTRGQTATQVVEMARPVPKSYMLIPLEGSPAQFARGEMQPTYFGDRKELEKHVRSRAVVIAP